MLYHNKFPFLLNKKIGSDTLKASQKQIYYENFQKDSTRSHKCK